MQTHCRESAGYMNECRLYILCFMLYFVYLSTCKFDNRLHQIKYAFNCLLVYKKLTVTDDFKLVFFLSDKGDKTMCNSSMPNESPTSLPPGVKRWIFLSSHVSDSSGRVGVSLASQTCFSCLCPSTSRRQLKTSLES